jgi:hypothetical protein
MDAVAMAVIVFLVRNARFRTPGGRLTGAEPSILARMNATDPLMAWSFHKGEWYPMAPSGLGGGTWWQVEANGG